MITLKTIAVWRHELASIKAAGKSVGFVPTMGALHPGHLALVSKSLDDNDVTVVSIFVNPTQFNDPDDLKNYPVTLQDDVLLLEKMNTGYLFLPDFREIYPDGFTYQVEENELSGILCGMNRPGHFRGVLTVVMKLLNIIRADRAYFGEKDFQQLLLIKGMVQAFFLDTEIIPVLTVRDNDGLALSSRNLLLDEKSRKIAPALSRILSMQVSADEIRSLLEKEGFEVDYVTDFSGRRFGAVKIGGIRLIDNVKI